MRSISWLAIACFVLLLANSAWAQGTAFTYQGRLTDTNAAANGLYDFQFKLYATANDSNVLGTVTVDDLNVTNGVFTVQLDFGATHFANNAAQFLEICVRLGSQTGAYTTLTPRQRVNATPYALKSALASDALQLNGVAASQYVQTNDARLSDARPPTAGSANYIQNTTTAQAASNFNISGNGLAGGTLSGNVVNAVTQFNLNGQRILSAAGVNNLAVGVGSGSGGSQNTSVGALAAASNTGTYNAFFGWKAGAVNRGVSNTFFGPEVGSLNTTGFENAFFGDFAGSQNVSGSRNAFFGNATGALNNADQNAFFGHSAGILNVTGHNNTFLGVDTGYSNVSGIYNVLIGSKADTGANNLRNAMALGAWAQVDCSDCLVLGSISGLNESLASVNVGLGTSAPQARLHVKHDSISGNQWGMQLENAAQTTLRGGLRLSNSGFLEISNNILSTSPNFARLDGTGNWTAVSDARRKRDITPLNGLLAGALQLHPVSYRYTHESAAAPKSIGFIAQEVEALFPALVTDGEIKTLNYAGLSVVAIGALQEQQRQIVALKAQVESLKQLVCVQQPQAKVCQP